MRVTFIRTDEDQLIRRVFGSIETIAIIKDKNDGEADAWQLIDKDDVEVVLRKSVWQISFVLDET